MIAVLAVVAVIALVAAEVIAVRQEAKLGRIHETRRKELQEARRTAAALHHNRGTR